MLTIKEYLLSKHKSNSTAQMRFPIVPDFDDIVDFLENKGFERIKKCPKLLSNLIREVESGKKYTTDIFSSSSNSTKDGFFIAFGDGEVSKKRPLFSMYIYKNDPHKNFYIENYDLGHTKEYRENEYEEFVEKINNTFGWQ